MSTKISNLPLKVGTSGVSTGEIPISIGGITYKINPSQLITTTTDLYISGFTFNPATFNLTITRNDNTVFTQSLAVLANANLSGTTNYISKWSTSTSLGNSLIFDNGTQIGISTTAPTVGYLLHVNGKFKAENDSLINGVSIGKGGGNVGSNVVLGANTLVSNGAGINNTAIGTNVLNANISDYNTGVGTNVLPNNIDGSMNTGLGVLALNSNTSGSGNIGIGYQAGRFLNNGSNNATGLNNIYIGNDTSSLGTSQNNEIVIGSTLSGSGSNTVTIGNSNIITTRLRGTVRGGAFAVDGGFNTQFLKADGTLDSTPYLTGETSTLQSVTSRGSATTLTIQAGGFKTTNGTSLQYLMADGSVSSGGGGGSISGAGTTNTIAKFTAGSGVTNSTIIDNGTVITLGINTNVSGNLTATNIVRNGGTSSQFLKADGTIDSNSYLTTYNEISSLQDVTNRGASTTFNITAAGFKTPTGTASQFLKANGTIDSSVYLTGYTELDTLTSVTTKGSATTNSIKAASFIRQTGGANDFMMADGSINSKTYITGYTETSTLQTVTNRGSLTTNVITAQGFVLNTPSTNLLRADGTTIPNTFLSTESDTLQTTTSRGNSTTTSITAQSFIKQGGSGSQYLMADGTTTTGSTGGGSVLSVFGRAGVVVAVSGDYSTTQVIEGTNLYYTDARVNANATVTANTAARHSILTIGTGNGLSLPTAPSQVLSLGLASAGVTGALSGADWSTFNGKQGALGYTPVNQTRNIGTTAPLQGGGNLSADLSLTITQATSSTNGFLTSGDWQTFNAKQPQINGTGFVKANGTTLSYDPNTYLTVESDTLQTVTTRGNSTTQNLIATKFIKSDAVGSEFLLSDGSTKNVNLFLTGYTETSTLQNVTSRGSITTTNIQAASFMKTGSNGLEFLMGDGTVSTSIDGGTY